MEYDNKALEKLTEEIKRLDKICTDLWEVVSTQRETIEAHKETIKHLRRE